MLLMLDSLDRKLQELQALRPLDAARVRALGSVFTAFETELIATSNQIEGNTLTIRETALVIEKGMTIGGKPLKDHLEALNHKAALDWIKSAGTTAGPITQAEVLEIHRLVPVRITGSRHVPPNALKVPDLMDAWEANASEQWTSLHPVHLAADLHEKLADTHPFIDGNGRTSRLVMNLALLRHGWPLVVIPSESALRLAYYESLEKAQTGVEPDAFRQFTVARVDAMLDRYLEVLREMR
jgi:Fic family protein